METTTQEAPVHYNPNQLVTYKVIDLDSRDTNGPEYVAHYPTEKVSTIEYALEQARRTTDSKNALQSKINRIIDNLTIDYWYNPNTDKETVLQDLCEILEHEPKQTVTISATIDIELEVDIALAEYEDFDAEDFVTDVLTIDSYHGDTQINDWSIRNVDVN